VTALAARIAAAATWEPTGRKVVRGGAIGGELVLGARRVMVRLLRARGVGGVKVPRPSAPL